jgi:uncharacterized membrane protein YcaP (DUF421 family)
MTTIILRSIIIYVIVLLVVRVMGKRQIAQMQPFDVVVTLIIADLATIPMSDLTIPLLNGIVPLFILTILHFVLTLLSSKNIFLRKFVNGKAIILVGPQGILENNVKSLNLTIADILEACRYAGYLSLKDVSYVIMETNGNISIIPTSNSSEVTREDLNIIKQNFALPYMLISDGKISGENLKRFNITQETLNNFLKEQKCKLKDVIVMQYNKTGEIFFQTKNNGKKVLTENLSYTQKDEENED